jgi:hypothetical protein
MKFPPSVPRRAYSSDKVSSPSHCPECGGRTEPGNHTYMMAVRYRGEVHPFVVGTTGGWFCKECPVIVLDNDAFAAYVRLVMPHAKGYEFLVLGIVDLDAVPQEKRRLPFDEKTNPIPLVEFTNLRQTQPPGKP